MTAWTMRDNGYEVGHTHVKALCRNEHEGVVYITTTDLCVYVSFPMLNVISGKTEELWLTREQYKNFQSLSHARELEDQPHPRLFELPKIGMKNPNPKKPLSGYTGSHSLTDVSQDKGGHWWHGSDRRFSARPYYKPAPTGSFKMPELRFIFPHLNYLGPDDGSLIWQKRWGNRTNDQDVLIICTSEIRDIITELSMWGYYVPTGRARTDEKLARKQAEAARSKLFSVTEKALETATKRVAELEPLLASVRLDRAKGDELAEVLKAECKLHLDVKVELVETIKALQARVEELEDAVSTNDTLWSRV